jgi:hypothetical protein
MMVIMVVNHFKADMTDYKYSYLLFAAANYMRRRWFKCELCFQSIHFRGKAKVSSHHSAYERSEYVALEAVN